MLRADSELRDSNRLRIGKEGVYLTENSGKVIVLQVISWNQITKTLE